MDLAGHAANHTGTECLPWAGGIVEGEVAVQGNILAGEHVVRAMLDAYRGSEGAPFVERLLRALEAGDAAGGDRRGKQSACVRVWREGAAYGGGLDVAPVRCAGACGLRRPGAAPSGDRHLPVARRRRCARRQTKPA